MEGLRVGKGTSQETCRIYSVLSSSGVGKVERGYFDRYFIIYEYINVFKTHPLF